MSLRRLIRSGPVALRAISAIFLLAVSLGDLAIDLDCDPLPLNAGALVVTGAPDGDADACTGGCLPDCFCCSRSLGAEPRISPPARNGVTALVGVAAPGLPSGFSLLSEHPPRARV